MRLKQAIIVLAAISLLSACSVLPYKKADLSLYAGNEGYLDKELSPGVHLIEVTQYGGYKDNSGLFVPYWHRRAAELCPNGYEGEPQMIFAPAAQIEEFVCEVNFCQYFRVASGVARCKT